MKALASMLIAAVGMLGCNSDVTRSRTEVAPGSPEFAVARGVGTVRDLGTLGGRSSEAQDINNSGQVVGWSEITSGVRHAFVWTSAGGMQDLGTLGGSTSEANGIDGAGDIVGKSTTASGQTHAFLRTAAGEMSDLGAIGAASYSSASAINDNEEIVGATGSGGDPFFWSVTGMEELGTATSAAAWDLNNLRQVVGYQSGSSSNSVRATLWMKNSSGTWVGQDLGSLGGESQALAVNESGTVVGLSRLLSGDVRAFVWTPSGGMVQLASLPDANRSDAYDINEAGDIAGESRVKLTNYGVLWTKTATGWVLQRLPSLSNSVGDSWANAINDNSPRQIVGYSTVPGAGHHAVLWTVP